MRNKLNVALIVLLLSPMLVFGEELTQPDNNHLDELKVNSNLQLRDVLEKTIARNPMQSTLQSR
ncbi:MAG: hypothetical protein Q7T42_07740, partial [Methylotenera sp.]